MEEHSNGFSLIELLVALTVTALVVTMMFQLFHQNERVVRDQTLITEMQQTARVVASQIADEIRMAGQGVPVHPSRFDTVPSEAVAIILSSSNTSRSDKASTSTVRWDKSSDSFGRSPRTSSKRCTDIASVHHEISRCARKILLIL